MKLYNLYKDSNLLDYIKCRIDDKYIINNGVILEDGYNILGYILYNIEVKNDKKIAHIDYLFIEEDNLLEIILNKFYNKLKYLKFNLILNSINIDIDLINRYIDLKYKLFNILYTKYILYKNIL